MASARFLLLLALGVCNPTAPLIRRRLHSPPPYISPRRLHTHRHGSESQRNTQIAMVYISRHCPGHHSGAPFAHSHIIKNLVAYISRCFTGASIVHEATSTSCDRFTCLCLFSTGRGKSTHTCPERKRSTRFYIRTGST